MKIVTLMLKKMCVVVVLCLWWGGATAFADTKLEKQITNSIGMKFALIPAGKFTMGSPPDERLRFDNEKQVSVTLTRAFYLGTTEVTQFQWQSVMGTRPWIGKEYVKEGKDYPATYVSWKDAVAFCKKLTEVERRAGRLPTGWEYRLPTEAQWEYACRAGSTKAYGIDDGSSFRDYAWHDGTVKGEKYAHQVGQKRANAYGLHDMHGNLWEWCQDYYIEALPGGTDPQGPSEGAFRICRGGGWFDTDWACRSARRQWYMSGSRFNFLGFRVSRVPSSQ